MGIEAARIPSGWAHALLEAVCQILDSRRIPLNNSERSQRIAGKSADDLYPYYGATGQVGVIDDYIFDGKHVLLGEDGAPFLDPFKVKSYLVDGKFWVNNHAHILKSAIPNKYLCHYLNQIDYSNYVTGTTRLKLTQNALKRIPVHVAPIVEQRRIVAKIEELFSELDKGIESLKTARAKLNIYRQAVLKNAFEGKLTTQWREENKDKLETPEQLLARIKQEQEARYKLHIQEWKAADKNWEAGSRSGKRHSKPRKVVNLRLLDSEALANVPPMPEGYAYTYLANLGELGRGKSKHRPRNAPDLFGGPYPFIQTGEVKAAGRIIREYSQTYSELGLEQSKLWPEGTLCITIAANIAETSFLGFEGCFPDSIVGFTATKTLVLPEYVELFIKSVRTQIEAYAPATAQKNINLTTLQSLVVPLCSLEEQRALVNQLEAVLSVIDDQRVAINNQLLKADALRQSILKKAFNGQLVPQDPHDEPASILLERIKAEKAARSQKNTRAKRRRRKATA